MSATVQLFPRTDRGRELLDQLEDKTGVLPFRTDADGARTYWLGDKEAGVDGFDVMLDGVDPDWRNHLTRSGYGVGTDP